MKKIFIFTLMLINLYLNSIGKPLILTGIKSYSAFKMSNALLYPNSSNDALFFKIKESFNKYLSLNYSFDFIFSDNIKLTDDLRKLSTFNFNNGIGMTLNIKRYKLLCSSKFNLNLNANKLVFQNLNLISFSYSITNFKLKISYYNNYKATLYDVFNHKISFNFNWNFKKYNFLKFNTATDVYLQHKVDGSFNLSPLKKVKINIAIALDFDKIPFERVFSSDDEELDDFQYEID
ncbi:MAG TPA: hypothetical protein PK385_10580 [Spirochaetota bacterium]|nr:hypothetical protein [Spirochaetota bacterium]HOS32684.1 hypothetical protein [Spirochaetota bacterium]HOS56491.1 hypothetical protein [Spirochaetota bacterium]HQF78290.1 hypothetical protein [Spirochaetota bacterium]HQH29348.1 hypothetical protein [Spirochaetota bacterium]